MKERKFFVCEHCGNLVEVIESSGVPMVCCGQNMTELVPNTKDAAVEKHVPVVTVNGDVIEVNVGSVDHPMIEEHHIAWIYLLTENGGQLRELDHTGKPAAKFNISADKPVKVLAYCNLHGLWEAPVK